MLINKEKRYFRKSLLKHEISILKSFNCNPYNCPRCDVRMNFIVEITWKELINYDRKIWLW